jgi:hypothetical protein
MIEIRPFSWEDEQYDSCGNTTVAVLKVGRITIPLCMTCLEELSESLSEFNNTTFCYQCKNFIMSRDGWNYGGSCNKDGDVELKNAGFINCKDCMSTCKYAAPKDN